MCMSSPGAEAKGLLAAQYWCFQGAEIKSSGRTTVLLRDEPILPPVSILIIPTLQKKKDHIIFPCCFYLYSDDQFSQEHQTMS